MPPSSVQKKFKFNKEIFAKTAHDMLGICRIEVEVSQTKLSWNKASLVPLLRANPLSALSKMFVGIALD